MDWVNDSCIKWPVIHVNSSLANVLVHASLFLKLASAFIRTRATSHGIECIKIARNPSFVLCKIAKERLTTKTVFEMNLQSIPFK